MRATGSSADWSVVTSGDDDRTRGEAIRRRVEALGISDREWHRATGMARATLVRAMEGGPVRASTLTAIESELDRLETLAAGKPIEGHPRGHVEDEHGGVIRIRLEGVFGAEAAIVEAPADNPDALAAALDVIMRRMQGGDGTADTNPV